jgi:hypothetical protein
MRNITRLSQNQLHLQVNKQKSAVRKPLNYEIWALQFESTYKKGDRGQYTNGSIQKQPCSTEYKIKTITRKTIPASFDERHTQVKPVIRGWSNYFKQASIHGKPPNAGWMGSQPLRYCIWHQWKETTPQGDKTLPGLVFRTSIQMAMGSQPHGWLGYLV